MLLGRRRQRAFLPRQSKWRKTKLPPVAPRLHKVAQGWTGVDLSPERFRSSLHRSSKLHQVRTLWIPHWCTLHRANLHHKLCKEECVVVKLLLLHIFWGGVLYDVCTLLSPVILCKANSPRMATAGVPVLQCRYPFFAGIFAPKKTGERCDISIGCSFYTLNVMIRTWNGSQIGLALFLHRHNF